MRPPPSPAHARRPTARLRPRGVVAPLRFLTPVIRALLVAAAVGSSGRAAGAQGAADTSAALVRVDRAFEPAVTLWFGATNFGNRSSTPDATFGYSSALSLGVTGDYPITRRTAFMADLSFVPGAKQEVSGGGNGGSFNASSALVVAADAGLAARLKANVPVFFFAGVGVMHASRYAYPLAGSGGATEPRGTIAIGFDGGHRSGDRVGLRAVAAAHFAKPADAGAAEVTTKSLTTDYTFELGAHIRLSGAGGAR